MGFLNPLPLILAKESVTGMYLKDGSF